MNVRSPILTGTIAENGDIFIGISSLLAKYLIQVHFESILGLFVTKISFEQNSNVEKTRKLRKVFLTTWWQ